MIMLLKVMTMMNIDIHITNKVKKDLRKLGSNQDKNQVIKNLKQLQNDPYMGSSLSGDLHGYYSLHFSLSGGAARAIYTILEEEKIVLIILVGYRENIYKEAKRRIK